jgi:hypothetical protein
MKPLLQLIEMLKFKNLLAVGILLMASSVFAQLCPPFCEVPPVSKVLAAGADTLSVTNPSGGAVNLLANDTSDAAVITSSLLLPMGDLAIGITSDAGLTSYLSLDATSGYLTVSGILPVGSYTINYQICQTTYPSNCVAGTLTLTVVNKTMSANADSISLSPVATLVTVLANDYVGPAIPASIDTVTVTIVNDGGLTGLSVNASGQLVVPTRTAGTYSPTYKICEVLNPTNCSAIVTVTITAQAGPIAVADAATISAAGGVVDYLANDTFNGSPASISLVTTQGGSPLPAGVTQNAAGQLVFPAGGTPGVYAGSYRICEIAAITNCSAYVAVNITILAVPVATADTSSLTTAGGTVNILANDTYNGAAATSGTVTPVIVTATADSFSFNAAGQLVVSSIAVGSHTMTYKLCTVALMSNCSAAVNLALTIASASATLVTTADVATVAAGGVVNVLSNDTFNAAAATLSNVIPSFTTTPAAGFSFNASGQLAVASNVGVGSYSVSYRICELSNLTNCSSLSTSYITVTAAAAALVATADAATIAPIATTVTVLTNDTVNGAAATTTNAAVTIVSDGGLTGLSVNASGQLVVPARAPSTSSAPTYKICEIGNLTNCSAAVAVTLTTLAGPVAVADTGSLVVGAGGTFNLLANDTFNGLQATSSNVSASLVAPVTGFSLGTNGQLVVATTVAVGSYPVAYKICDLAAATSCSGNVNATVTVTAAVVAGAGLVAADDGITMPLAGGSLNVLTNDKYNSVAITASMVAITLTSNGGASGATLSSAGDLYISIGLVPGSYLLTYKICLISSPTTCASAKVSIIISASVTSAVRKAPSVSGATSSTSLIITTGQSPISFGTGGPTVAGSINDALVFSGVRASFGENVGGLTFLNLRASQDIPKFNALLFYSGSGQLKARWEVIQPGDPDPNELDLVPEDGLTLAQKVQRHTYTLIDRSTGYLAPMGSYQLLGPDPSRLPKSRLGTYRILLRLEAMGSGTSGAFYIPFITYRIQSDPIVETPIAGKGASDGAASTSQVKSRFTANTNVADFSKIGELDVGASISEGGGIKIGGFEKKVPLVGFESINTKQPKAGQQIAGSEPLKLEWDEAKAATVDFWHLEIRNDAGGDLLTVARVVKKTDYVLARPLASQLPRDKTLRWRVQGVDKEGHVTATSAWLFFTVTN